MGLTIKRVKFKHNMLLRFKMLQVFKIQSKWALKTKEGPIREPRFGPLRIGKRESKPMIG